MKKLGIFFIAITLLSACTKEELMDLLPSMSATIDGKEWVSTKRITVEENGTFVITGNSANGETLIITIFGTEEGLYELDGLKAECAAAFGENLASELGGAPSISGSVNLTNVSTKTKTISGTFEFTMLIDENFVEITNGEFTRIAYDLVGL